MYTYYNLYKFYKQKLCCSSAAQSVNADTGILRDTQFKVPSYRVQSQRGQDGTFPTNFKGSPWFGAWSKDDELCVILIELRDVLDLHKH